MDVLERIWIDECGVLQRASVKMLAKRKSLPNTSILIFGVSLSVPSAEMKSHRLGGVSSTPPRFRRDYPLNLSISVSGGKESNSDSRSSGERNGNSPARNLPGYQACGEMLRQGNGR